MTLSRRGRVTTYQPRRRCEPRDRYEKVSEVNYGSVYKEPCLIFKTFRKSILTLFGRVLFQTVDRLLISEGPLHNDFHSCLCCSSPPMLVEGSSRSELQIAAFAGSFAPCF